MNRDDRMVIFVDRTRTLIPMPALIPMSEYGKCTACGSVEVRLNMLYGTTTIPGDPGRYPVGYGCEMCD